MDILSKLSENLKYLMAEREKGTPALAAETGIDQSVIARFLRGERLPSLTTLVLLADYFGCSTDCLLGLVEESGKSFKPRPPFAERISFLLKRYSLSKYRLAADAGISELSITAWQRGKYEPSLESAVKLAAYLGCSLDYLLGRI